MFVLDHQTHPHDEQQDPDQADRSRIVVFVARHVQKSKTNLEDFLGKFLSGSLVLGRSTLGSKKMFKIGTGFTDRERDAPPAIGSLVTYKYQNFTNDGLPRFPVYMRVRTD